MPHTNISRTTIEEITTRADLLDVAQHFQPELRKKSNTYKGKCPHCNSDNLAITPSKNIFKCFSCQIGGNGAVGYLMKLQGNTFREAITFLSDRYNILIAYDDDYTHPDHNSTGVDNTKPSPFTHYHSFRDEQLRSSGIPEEVQRYTVKVGDEEEIRNRYGHGMIDHLGEVKPGYDMLLHYLDLDGAPIMYKLERARNKVVPYIRIRFAIPDQHLDKEGKAIRYKSPTGGGNHLWIPEYIRRAYLDQVELPVLSFIEGEKKADALCVAGIPAAGIAGIHNFATDNEMPGEIERLIRSCGVKAVVFFVDSDFDDLGKTIPTPADLRPRTFFKAALKFKKYFDEYRYSGFPVDLYIAHGIDRAYKGMDDLLVHLRGEDTTALIPKLEDDLKLAMHSHAHAGQHIRAYDITAMHPQQIEEIWHLHSTKAFRDHHADRLKEVTEFRLQGINYHWNKETSAFEVSDKLMNDEKYWRKRTNKNDREEYEFYNTGFYEFLSRRGYGQIEVDNEQYRLVHVEKNIVTAVDHTKISRHVIAFTKEIDEPEVLEMIYKGGRLYIGPERLSNTPIIVPEFIKPKRDRQFMFFKNTYWEITPQKITEHKYISLPGAVWADDIIDFSPQLIQNPVTLVVSGDKENPKVKVESNVPESSDIVRFFIATSDILWRTATDKSVEAIQKRTDILYASMADKILATGYVMSDYMDPANMKAIIPMDALESESGRSEGGTGKSFWATMFEELIPTVVIPAKNPKLTEDPHLYENVNERTRLVVFDDCRRNLDFETFLSDITRGVTSNPKGQRRRRVGYKRFIFPTNHSIRGEDRSYIRRQYPIAFSDYFNLDRTPYTEFGHAMIVEWEFDQFNSFFNFIAGCIQANQIHGLVSFAPSADIDRRKLRDFISEPVLEFLETYFYHGSNFVNSRFDIQDAIKQYLIDNPNQRQFVTKRYMRERIKAFCKYAGYDYNPAQKGGRIRDGSKNIEFFIIGDKDYIAGMEKLNTDAPTFTDDRTDNTPKPF